MKPFIQRTSFGSITIDNRVYEKDVLIRPGGLIEKRKKKLSKNVYGTSHILSREEAEFVYEAGLQKVVIGCGQYGAMRLSAEASEFFHQKQVALVLEDTPDAIQTYNKERDPCAGLFHVTC